MRKFVPGDLVLWTPPLSAKPQQRVVQEICAPDPRSSHTWVLLKPLEEEPGYAPAATVEELSFPPLKLVKG